ncbi:MAG: motility protein A [Firmicutes bacterium]|jgi:chemotaxis protein MotA|nr:motility protein A [Bacillota bacterium]
MDLATLLGITLGIGLLVGAILLEGDIRAYWSFSSVLIVFGGTFAATLINFSLKQVLSVFPLLRVAFLDEETDSVEVINTLVEFAESSRREGLLALEEKAQAIDEPFLQKGIQLVVDGTDAELVRNILEIELVFLEERHRLGQRIFEQMGALSPAFGMIGTLIGLIGMLSDLNDPDQIGIGMAVALITTLYGAVASNLIFLPIAGKLRIKSDEEILIKQVMIEGILSIQAGENPRIVEEKLKSFLSPLERANSERERSVEGVTADA